MTKKIIAVDLDGTLLNSESKLSDFTQRDNQKFQKKDTMLSSRRDVRIVWQKDFYRELEIAYSP